MSQRQAHRRAGRETITVDGTTATPATTGALVDDIMRRDVLTTTADVAIVDVARLMRQHRLTGVPVLDSAGVLIGVVTEYDIVSKRGSLVGDIMSRGVITVTPGTPASRVVDLVGLHGIRGIPVLQDQRFVGLVTRADLVDLYLATRWVCASCGRGERGMSPPPACPHCSASNWRFDHDAV
jgi:CBS domain-containing protein